MQEYKNILVCTDCSEKAHAAFSHALSLAKKHSATLHLILIPHSPYTYAKHIVDEHIPEGKGQDGQAFFDKEIAEYAERVLIDTYQQRLGDFKNYKIAVTCGSPDIEIVRYAKANSIDLIVMGPLGRADTDESVSCNAFAKVGKYAPCQLMVIQNQAG